MIKKICPECSIEKYARDFNKNANSNDGLQNVCRECANAKRRVEAIPENKFYYISSTYEYPSADQVDDDEITTQVDAVNKTLEAALDYQMEQIQCLCAPHEEMLEVRRAVYMRWDPINNVMTMRYRTSTMRFLVTKVEMYNDN